MKILLIAFISLSTVAFGNPVATAIVEKTWERCVISAGEKFSTVSCAVGYKGKEFLNAPFYISVPVVLPASLAVDETLARRVVKARLEIGGKVYDPCQIMFGNDPLMPNGTIRANCLFHLGGVPGRSFAIVVSYEQPTINGKVFYLPQFEEGKNPRDFAEFSVSVFPTDGGLLTLESKHAQDPTSFATRVTVKPVHNEIIKVGYNRSGQAALSDGDKPSN